jgi:hypothetical protein
MGCNKLVLRDNMKSSTITIYGDGVGVVDEKIRVRLCPSCSKEQYKRWKNLEWQVKMWTEEDILADPELAKICEGVDFKEDPGQ